MVEFRRKLLFLFFLVFIISCVPEDDAALDSFEAGSWNEYKTSDGLAGNTVLSLFEDSKGNIWIGTFEDGVSVFNGESFKNYDVSDGLSSNYVSSITEDKDGRIWFATDAGVSILDDGDWYYLIYFEGVACNSLVRMENGDILVATGGYGVHRYDISADNIEVYYQDEICGLCNNANIVFVDTDENVWIGTDQGIIRKKGNSIKEFTSENLSTDRIFAIKQDKWGNIWVGTREGETSISRITGNDAEEVYLNGFDSNWTYDFAVQDDGTVWISTLTSGLYRYDGALMRKELSHLQETPLTSLLKDSKGNIWIGTIDSGLAKHVPN